MAVSPPAPVNTLFGHKMDQVGGLGACLGGSTGRRLVTQLGSNTPKQRFPTHARRRSTIHFATTQKQVDDQAKSAAKLALYLLKQPDGTPAAAAPRPAALARTPSALAREDASTPAAAASAAAVTLRGVISDAAPDEGGEGEGAAAAMDALDSLVQLLEQYYHPSNGGSWSSDLAVFLRQVGLVSLFRLVCRSRGGCVSGEEVKGKSVGKAA
jgi:hypothetical protein